MEPITAVETKGKMILFNSMEEIILEKTKEITSKMDICHCEKCYYDVCALVLNQTPPKYVTSVKGKLMAKLPSLSNKKELELTILITKIAKMVAEKPMH